MFSGEMMVIAFVVGAFTGALFLGIVLFLLVSESERRYREDVYKPRDYRCGEPPHYRQK